MDCLTGRKGMRPVSREGTHHWRQLQLTKTCVHGSFENEQLQKLFVKRRNPSFAPREGKETLMRAQGSRGADGDSASRGAPQRLGWHFRRTAESQETAPSVKHLLLHRLPAFRIALICSSHDGTEIPGFFYSCTYHILLTPTCTPKVFYAVTKKTPHGPISLIHCTAKAKWQPETPAISQLGGCVLNTYQKA